jgi:hypothetical protein
MNNFWNGVAKVHSYESPEGFTGMILLMLKAYEVLHDIKYKQLAEEALGRYPFRTVHWNLTQANGLAALGELYLEASQVLRLEQWKDRANWIAGAFIHTFCRHPDGSGYWKLEEHNPPTANFLTGLSGIIHFLARCIYPGKIGYRLLN